MNKDEYRSAIGKIKASDEFKAKVEASMELQSTRRSVFKLRWMAPALAVLIVFIYFSSTTFITMPRQSAGEKNKAEEFRITGSTSGSSASYISVVYLDGYAYSPSEWLKYSRYGSDKDGYEEIKGDRLGAVTLDLKGKVYTGTPPDFSSTHDVGTEVYTIKNIKKERAVLVASRGFTSIFYRENKAVPDENTKINLNVSDVFKMMTDSPKVTAVELRDEYDGSWMRTSENGQLLSLINKELPKQSLQSLSELGQNPYGDGFRIPVNLIFEDGTALHMQVLPESKSASFFGGFIRLSPELCTTVRELFDQGNQYPSFSDLLPYKEGDTLYMHFINHTNGDEILCENPKWSRTPLFSIFNYYRIEEIRGDIDGSIVMTSKIGKSQDSSITVDFYETKEKYIILKFNGNYYKPVKGKMIFDELHDYLYNYTELGNKRR